jgi:thiol-disulfide isomerase/thioredoxin
MNFKLVLTPNTNNMRLFITFFTLLLLTGCNESETEVDLAPYKNVIEQKIVDFEGYKSAVMQKDNVLYVVNFWATWCVPCVEELPQFIELNEQFRNERFNMTFVTLDGAKDFEKRVLPFAEKHNMNADLLLLDDVKNMNTWIKEVNPKWSGAIPATVFYKNGKQLYFKEGQLSKAELETLIKKHL